MERNESVGGRIRKEPHELDLHHHHNQAPPRELAAWQTHEPEQGGESMKRLFEKFLSAFGSMLDISPRPHKPIQPPPLERGIGRHFDAALARINHQLRLPYRDD